jgi:hypothetical protein
MVLQQLSKYDEKQQPTAITRLHCCSPQDVTKEGYKIHMATMTYNSSIIKAVRNHHEVTSTNYREAYL